MMTDATAVPSRTPTRADKSGRRRGRGSDSEHTRGELIDAAIRTVVEHGLRGTTARQIAQAAGCNQASIYYHFDGVDGLLIAALTDSNARRLAAYRQRLDPISDTDEMFDALDELHIDDLASGHLTLTAELVAGLATQADLRVAVVATIEPWVGYIADTIRRVADGGDQPLLALPADLLADLVMSVIIGEVLRSNLDGDQGRYCRYVNFARVLTMTLNTQILNTQNLNARTGDSRPAS